MSRSLRLAALTLLLAGPVVAQTGATPATPPKPLTLTAPVPTDPAVTVGTLPNGIRFYIRQNAKPEKRAELRLVVNAGSIQEDENQLGLAHFLEHTAFNGTTNFKKNELVSYLESIGVKFGADLNASTNFDETIYILPVPTDTPQIVERGFQILEDWAHGQLFDATEVTNERGVVLEEWRGRKGASERMLKQWLPVALKGSLYTARMPIGTERSIMSASPERLRSFYNDWYRPDLMAVIAVGDFNKADIEALIRKHFGGIKAPASPRPRVVATVPSNVAPLVAIATDKEATTSSVNIVYKLPTEKVKTVGDYRRALAERLYLGMFNNRLAEITQKPDAPFVFAGSSKGSFLARSLDAFTLVAAAKEGQIETGVEALLNEARRVDQFGFLDAELARAKTNMLRGYERVYAERAKSPSAAFVGEYIGNFLLESPTPGVEWEYGAVQQLLPTITIAEINTLARTWISDENRVIIVQAPAKEGLKVPTEAEVLAVFDRASRTTLTAYTEAVSSDPLMESLPQPGSVVSERRIEAVNVTDWKLSNGVRVLIKPTDFKADEIIWSASSPGGASLVADKDYVSASNLDAVLESGGLGKFNQIDLRKKLAGKVASASASVGDIEEVMVGSASPKDLETMFQLINMTFTAPRLDTVAYRALSDQVVQFLKNMSSNPESVFGDTVGVVMSQHHFRDRPFNAETFKELNPVRAFEIFKERFADASDFTFVFTGNIDLATFKPLVERFIGSLPALNRNEKWKDNGSSYPTGVIEKVVRKGKEPKAETLIMFTGPFVSTPQSRFEMRALMELAQMRATETLREQLGGTYSPSVEGSGQRVPKPTYSISFSYSSSPENVEKLTQSVFSIIAAMKAAPPTDGELTRVKEQIIRSREVDLKTNRFWLSNISARIDAGEDLAGLLGPYDEMVQKLTGAQLQAAAKQYFNIKNYARFLLLPEN
ncbi:MAG: insulinase family protein [Longimicrobiales bacterium]